MSQCELCGIFFDEWIHGYVCSKCNTLLCEDCLNESNNEHLCPHCHSKMVVHHESLSCGKDATPD